MGVGAYRPHPVKDNKLDLICICVLHWTFAN